MANDDSFPSWENWQKLEPEVKEYRQYETLYYASKNTNWKRILFIGGCGGALVSTIIHSPILVDILQVCIR